MIRREEIEARLRATGSVHPIVQDCYYLLDEVARLEKERDDYRTRYEAFSVSRDP